MSTSLFNNTPSVTVHNARGLTVRELLYHRLTDTQNIPSTRITRHLYNTRGFLTQSTDPRLHDLMQSDTSVRPNFTCQHALSGHVLCNDSVDAGLTVSLNDAAGRPVLRVNASGTVRTWQYEVTGRLLSITEQVTGDIARIRERFVWAGNSDAEKALNLAGLSVRHYDTAGLVLTDSVGLTSVPLSITRHLLKDADIPGVTPDWQGANVSGWNNLLDSEAHVTLTTTDATGTVLTTTDAAGNVQRRAYNVAGLLKGSWLTMNGGAEQAIVTSLTYTAAGQKLCEVHGNGVMTTYTYEPQTQRLAGMKTERPSWHDSGAKVLQDLRYQYDPVGNVLKVTNNAEETRFWRNQKVVPENTYTYDSLYQLVTATGREMAGIAQQGRTPASAKSALIADPAAFTAWTRQYDYDTGGNLTRIRHSTPATNSGYVTDFTLSNRSNRGLLSTITTDKSAVDAFFTVDGYQASLQPGQSLTWTASGELSGAILVARRGDAPDAESYRYDSNSQRLLKVSMQKTGNSMQMQRVVYLPGLERRTAVSGGVESENLQVIMIGEAGRAQVRVLYWEKGKPGNISNSQVRYSYGDLIQSAGMELDSAGQIISQEEYYPYGGTAVWAARSAVEAGYKTVRYSGKERDATGLYYYGYRYYQPWVGRWLSADPAGTVDGLNLFTMVRNNPVSYYDNDGRQRKTAQEIFDAYQEKYTSDDRNFPFTMMQEITNDKIKFSGIKSKQQSMDKIKERVFTFRHYTTSAGGPPPFNEISSNFALVKNKIKSLARTSGSNTNEDDWNRLGNTAFTFFLLAVDGEVSDRKFLSTSTHYAEFTIEEMSEMVGADTEFFASSDLLHVKDAHIPSAKVVKGKVSDMKSLLVAAGDIPPVMLGRMDGKAILDKIDSSFNKTLEIKIPGSVKLKRSWNEVTQRR
ncbi:RHS repeat protein [Salmonella enterica]|nr:RHS repeat protein [Salmonella enterica]EGA0603423.1 RHS repeat protein [Salmonella enterica]EHD2148893.1 RHS repeat protein [Salmonella enterica]EHK2353382.1 RHS repeat protein [Salmonella enterica]